MKIQGKANQQGLPSTGGVQQGNPTQGNSSISDGGAGVVQGQMNDVGAQFFPGITDRPPHGNTFVGPEPTQFPGITDKPPHTSLPIVPGWQDGVAFDQLVDRLLGGNTSARPHEAQQIAEFLSTIPTSEDLVHAMRGLEKLSANNYFKGETIDTVNNAVYDRLAAFDPPVWGDAAAFDQLVGSLLGGNTSAQPHEAEQIAAFLRSTPDTSSLIHAMRSVEKLSANNYFKGETIDTVRNALYDKLIEFQPDSTPGWFGRVGFDNMTSDLLSRDSSATVAEAQTFAGHLASIDDPGTLMYAARNVEKLLANNAFKGEARDIVHHALYDRLIQLDNVWPDAASFDQMVEKLFSGNTSAQPQEAEKMGAFLNSITHTDQLVHAARAIKKLEANHYFKGEAKEIINDALYQNLAQFDRPTFNPLQLAGY